jgi:catechol 2,3-dioxygenase-like lactoylglutathione lyase family enzyme
MEQRISMITLGVADLAAARRFYGEGLGWREVQPVMDEIAFYQLPGLALSLWPMESLAEDAQVAPRVGQAFGGITIALNMRSPAEVDAVLAEAQAAGGRLLKAAHETFWGGYSGYFSDLDGHAWEVAHNPGCVITPEGATLFGEPQSSSS